MATATTTLDLAARRAQARTRARAAAVLVRPHTARLPVVVFLACGWRSGLGAAPLALGALAVAAAFGAAAALNDIHDVDADAANQRDRPLVAGDLPVGLAGRVVVGCLVVAAATGLALPHVRAAVVGLAALALGAAYSLPPVALARRGVLGTASLGVLYFALPAVLAGASPSAAALLGALAGGVGTILYKDVEDEPGDRLVGKRTPLVRWGRRRLDVVAATLGVVALVAGVVALGPGWWTAVHAGALVVRSRRLAAFRLLSAAGAVALLAV